MLEAEKAGGVRMAEQGYDLMHKDDVVASLQLDDLSGAIKWR